MAFDLLQSVDWNEWKRIASHNAPTAPIDPAYLPNSEAERIALLVLMLGNQVTTSPTTKQAKAINKIIRMALREIEQAVLTAEQDIDYEKC